MEFDLGFMTLMSVFFKNSFWILWLLLYLQFCWSLHLIQSLSMQKFLLASLGSCIRLCRLDPFACKVCCKTSTDFSVFSDQDFWISLCAYSHGSFVHWLFQICCTRNFFHIMIVFKKMQFQKRWRILCFFCAVVTYNFFLGYMFLTLIPEDKKKIALYLRYRFSLSVWV